MNRTRASDTLTTSGAEREAVARPSVSIGGTSVPVARFASVLLPLGAPWRLQLRVAGVGDAWPAGGSSGWVPLPNLLGQLPARHQVAVVREGDPRRQAADLVPWSVAVPALAYVLPGLLADVLPAVAPGNSGSDWLLHEHPVERVEVLPGRPRRADVIHTGGTSIFPVRSTCCLYYRTHPAHERDGDGYCVTCPLRTDGSRQRRLASYLDQPTDAS